MRSDQEQPYQLCDDARIGRYSRNCSKVLFRVTADHEVEFVSNDRDLLCFIVSLRPRHMYTGTELFRSVVSTRR